MTPSRVPLSRRVRLAALGVAVLGALASFLAPSTTAGAGTEVGVGLRLRSPQIAMEAVHAPARIMTVAARPRAADGEAWAVGRSDARLPEFDSTAISGSPEGGQDVFLRYDHASGWRIAGLPRRQDGSVVVRTDPAYSFGPLAIAPNGDGWAGTRTGQLFRRQAGSDDWVHAPENDAVLRNAPVISLSVGSDAAGTFGFALTTEDVAPRLLVLDEKGWRAEQPPDPPPGLFFRRVVAAGRGRAWMVGTAPGTRVPGQPQPWYVVLMEWSAQDGWRREMVGADFLDQPQGQSIRGVDVKVDSSQVSLALTDDAVWVAAPTRRTDRTGAAGSVLPPVSGTPDLAPTFLKPSDFSGQPTIARLALDAAGRLSGTKTFCPPMPRVQVGGSAEEVALCDGRLPLGIGPVQTIEGVADGAVMAVTPNGLLRFTSGAGGWRHEPTATLGAVGGSFGNADEGWIVTKSGGENSPPSSNHLSHWTRARSRSGLRRWPQPATQQLESVAVHPGTGAAALAVGGRGTAVLQLDDGTWDTVSTGTTDDLHATAWSDASTAWAVGDSGTALRLDASTRTWTADAAAAAAAAGADLLGIAFDHRGQGWAVGTGGTVLTLDGGSWRRENVAGVPAVTLNAVAVAGDDVIVVGDDATLLVYDTEARTWRSHDALRDELTYGSDGSVPHLLSVAGLRDGKAYVGGSTSVLLERRPDGTFVPSTLPALDGQIHALAAASTETGQPPVLVAAVGRVHRRYTTSPTTGRSELANSYGWGLVLDGGRWRDLAPLHAASAEVQETPVLRDPIHAIAVGEDGRGWAVGGLRAGAATNTSSVDNEGHSGPPSATSSMWRLDANKEADPESSPADITAAPLAPPGAVSLAFVGDSPCVAGLCSPTEGVGTRADAMLGAALADIDRAAEAGAVDVVVSGGDYRNIGLPDELGPVQAMFDELPVPWFGALGDRDLVSQLLTVTGVPGVPSVEAAVSADLPLGTFADAPKPWGHEQAPWFVQPVPDEKGPTFSERGDEFARTHYAFDYKVRRNGEEVPALRVVVLDTSRLPLALSQQNPNEDQIAWLQRVLLGATDWPAVVVMHRPLVTGLNEDSIGSQDAASVTAALVAGRASAVVAGHLPTNRRLDLGVESTSIPAVVSGALGRLTPEVATQGGFHAWVLVTVSPDGPAGLLGKPPLTVRTIPVLESVALHAPGGRSTAAGGTLQFEGVGRAPDAGTGRHSRKRAQAGEGAGSGGPTYLPFPFPGVCLPSQSSADGTCRDLLAAAPDYTFRCEDTTICDFVRRSISPLDPPGTPFRDPTTGGTVPDPTSGLLCARNPGSTFVRLEAGTVASRVPITITERPEGEQPCSPVPSKQATEPQPPPVQPQPEPEAQKAVRPAPPVSPAKVPATPVKAPPVKPFVKPAPTPTPLPEPLPVMVEAPSVVPRGQPSTQPGANIVVGAAVPPVANVTPAPPGGSGSPGAAHQKEEEVQAEMASMDMRDARDMRDVLPGVPLHNAAAALAGTIATAFLTARRRRLPTAAAAAPFRPATSYRRRRHQGARPR